jgi:hypothetical protein
MKISRLFTIAFLGCAGMLAQDQPSNGDLLKRLENLSTLTKFTKERVVIHGQLAVDCRKPDPPNHVELIGTLQAAIEVYVTPEGFASFVEPQTPFPVGTIVLKEKFAAAEAKSPELYTGMLKREKGYNPKCGDWEFFTLTGDRKAITARGRINSCMDCHQQYAKSDYVTRRYKNVPPPR